MDTEITRATQTYTFATWNIAHAKADEAFEQTRFDVRWPLILTHISDCDADILCLQELRNLETSAVSVADILHSVAQLGYDYKHAYYGPDSTAFALVIFFKRDKFFPVGLELHTLPLADPQKPNSSRILLTVGLRSNASGGEISFSTTHFGLEEDEKRRSAEFLASHLFRHLRRVVCAGDFNFFDDRDGQQHRQMLLDVSLDMAHPLENASGTFMGFEHDAFKQPFEKMSRLDHIFASHVTQVGQATAYCGDMETVRSRTYPSDHLMIVARFEM
jgi:endonuclease/exonuclease/phosphatase family metal-dependent hydrolase